MIKRARALFPLLIVGLFVGHGVVWLCVSTYLDYRLERMVERLAERGVSFSFIEKHRGGYPTRFYTHFQDVRLKVGEKWSGDAHMVSVAGSFFLPFTQKLHIETDGVMTLQSEDQVYTVKLGKFAGTLGFSPPALSLHSQGAVVLKHGMPVAEGERVNLELVREALEHVRVRLASVVKFWFPNPLSPTLSLGVEVNARISPPDYLKRQIRKESLMGSVHIDLDAFTVHLLGAVLKGKGTFEKSDETSWRGDVTAHLLGVSHFESFLKNVLPFKADFLIAFLAQLTQILKADPFEGLDLSCILENGAVRFKGFPFLAIPFGEIG